MSLPAWVALGTMHGKAAAVTPPFSRLGIALAVPQGLDTDRFGAFAGEVPRAGTMVESARAKALAAIRATGLPVGLGSEGAYGPHPLIPFLARGTELLLWHDVRIGQEVVETLVDDEPCYDRIEVRRLEEAEGFLARIGFPATGVVLGMPDGAMVKGIQDRDRLDALLRDGQGRPMVLQTDMRAHLNPRRMAVIGQLAGMLAARLAVRCPDCAAPGWGRLRPAPGLPCAWCDGPTLLPGGEVHGCTACGTEALVPRADGITMADPGHCPVCNP